MKFVIDVNVVLSALIRDSTTRKIIFKSGLNLYFPEPSLHKIRKYKDYILKKSGLSEDAYTLILTNLFKYIQLAPSEEIKKNWNKAKKIMEKIDQEDVVFIATALSLGSIIWSDDKDFEKQHEIKVFKTRDIIKLFL